MMRFMPAPAAAYRPTLLDYLLLLLGAGTSLYLMRLHPMHAEAEESLTEPLLREFVAFLPEPMRLSEGIVLLWPVFFAIERVRGRKQSLTAAEWLWVISWIGIALLTGLSAWEKWGVLPEFLQSYSAKPWLLWYVIFVPSMAALAAILVPVGLFRFGQQPWTHSLGLALVLWPALPLAGILLLGKFV
jgi:hypothetical protein